MQSNLFPNFKKYSCQGLAALGIVAACCQTAGATSHFTLADGWTEIAAEDNVGTGGFVGPGVGGQPFDAEYLAYKLVGNTLSIGLQSGFDLLDGHVLQGGINYYAGDLALSFNGTPTNYEYAFDFGKLTKNYAGAKVDADTSGSDGIDAAGLYAVSAWNLGVYSGYTASNPFAMDGGTLVTSGTTLAGLDGDSYWRTVSFDITALGLTNNFSFDAHWTMSCGNDAINGGANVAYNPPPTPVPEPATMLLFGTGLMGLAGLHRRKMNKA